MTALIVDAINLKFGKTQILNNIGFVLHSNETACLLGESGCGKTTLLRTIAGLDQAYSGNIHLNGKCLLSSAINIDASTRKVGFVFQDYALFPHLTVAQNIAFGLKNTTQQKSVVAEMLALVDLEKHAKKYPHQLSGGQQQRVAIARALAPKPQLLLLDEPFAHLDVHLREQLALDLRTLLKQQEITAIMVTHDQQEAFAFADNIGVMHNGQLEQWGSPAELYQAPASKYIASFIGEGCIVQKQQLPQNLQTSALAKLDAEDSVLLRPEAFELTNDSCNDSGDAQAVVKQSTFRGSYQVISATLVGTDADIVFYCPAQHVLTAGEKITLRFNAQSIHSLV